MSSSFFPKDINHDVYLEMRDEVRKMQHRFDEALYYHTLLRKKEALDSGDIAHLDALVRAFKDISSRRACFLEHMASIKHTRKGMGPVATLLAYKKLCRLCDALLFRSSVAFSKAGKVLNPLQPKEPEPLLSQNVHFSEKIKAAVAPSRTKQFHIALTMKKKEPDEQDKAVLRIMERCYQDVKRDARLVHDMLTCTNSRNPCNVVNLMKRMADSLLLFQKLEQGMTPGNKPETVALIKAKFAWMHGVHEKMRAFVQNPSQSIQ